MEKLKQKIMSEIAKRALKCDAYLEENKKTEVAVNDGAIDRVMEADSFGMGLRIFRNGKMGFGFSTIKDPAAVPALFDKVERTAYVEGYEGYVMTEIPVVRQIIMADKKYGSVTMKQKQQRALDLEAGVKNSSPKIKFVRDTTCSDNYTGISYMNSAGANCFFEKTYSYVFTSAVASDKLSDEAVDGMEGSVNWDAIDISALGADTGKRAAGLLRGASIASGKYMIILPPYVAVEFLQVISPMFFGSNLRRGKTLLKDVKSGDVLAPDFVNIMDNPVIDYAAGSFPVDGEGVAGSEKAVISGGRFGTFLYDKTNAEYFKLTSTGNALRASYKSLPETGVSNFYLAPGNDKKKSIMNAGKAVLVNSMMGLHMTDTVSGNFSLGINGWLMENGETKQAVKETLITGNVKDFLRSIAMAGDDFKFYFNYGSPTIAVKDIMVAGK